MDRGWIQFLLVAVPVVSLVGSWLALRVVADRRARRPNERKTDSKAKSE
jgi:hypothetical protein